MSVSAYAAEPQNLAYNASVLLVSQEAPNDEEHARHAFDNNSSDTKWCLKADAGWVVFFLIEATQPNLLTVYHAGGSSNSFDRTQAGITTNYALQILKNEAEYTANPNIDYLTNENNWQTLAAETNNQIRKSTQSGIIQAGAHKIYRFKVNDWAMTTAYAFMKYSCLFQIPL